MSPLISLAGSVDNRHQFSRRQRAVYISMADDSAVWVGELQRSGYMMEMRAMAMRFAASR